MFGIHVMYFKSDIKNVKNILICIYMSASFLPFIFVPFIGLVFPFITVGYFLFYVEKDVIS